MIELSTLAACSALAVATDAHVDPAWPPSVGRIVVQIMVGDRTTHTAVLEPACADGSRTTGSAPGLPEELALEWEPATADATSWLAFSFNANNSSEVEQEYVITLELELDRPAPVVQLKAGVVACATETNDGYARLRTAEDPGVPPSEKEPSFLLRAFADDELVLGVHEDVDMIIAPFATGCVEPEDGLSKSLKVNSTVSLQLGYFISALDSATISGVLEMVPGGDS